MFKSRIFKFTLQDMSSVTYKEYEIAIQAKFYFSAKYKINIYIDTMRKNDIDLQVINFKILK